jgi:hypothetical protein
MSGSCNRPFDCLISTLEYKLEKNTYHKCGKVLYFLFHLPSEGEVPEAQYTKFPYFVCSNMLNIEDTLPSEYKIAFGTEQDSCSIDMDEVGDAIYYYQMLNNTNSGHGLPTGINSTGYLVNKDIGPRNFRKIDTDSTNQKVISYEMMGDPVDLRQNFIYNMSVSIGHGINWVPVLTDCETFEKNLPYYVRKQSQHPTATIQYPPFVDLPNLPHDIEYKDLQGCECQNNVTDIRTKDFICLGANNACLNFDRNQTTNQIIPSPIVPDNKIYYDKAYIDACEACFKCRSEWEFCPKYTIDLCREFMQNKVTGGFDSMHQICNPQNNPAVPTPSPVHLSSGSIVGIVIGAIVGVLIMIYTGFKTLQYKTNFKNKRINRVVAVYEYIPRKTCCRKSKKA